MVGKGAKTNCKSASHKLFKDKAKTRVDDLQGKFLDLQFARKESRTVDVSLLEEQVHQMLREWKAELHEPSPASSLQQDGSLGFSSDIYRLLQLCEEEDDATSTLTAPKPEPNDQVLPVADTAVYHEGYGVNQGEQQHSFPLVDQCKNSSSGVHSTAINNLEGSTLLDYHHFDLHQEFEQNFYAGYNVSNFCGEDAMQQISGYLPALSARAQGKDVGIPECEGAATAKSPWNAPELFDLSVLEGETIREWLFFDKPRRAFESGNRKQRSLPDYSGRGWHESRKQVMNEFGGLKRSYYMDPQPLNHFEWHLYEYEINKCDACALYRLELKLVDGKKSAKGKLANDSVADLQKQMGRLTAEFPSDNKRLVKGRAKVNAKAGVGGNIYPASNVVASTNEKFDYGPTGQFDYLIENLSEYYLT
ncbi:transcription factor VOZ1 [Citrus sinensis]|uniref:Transcription factor VOZ1 n=1 Tax=Citrus sinensis TaxID=2711 RepID=A0ACB8NH19_CITSI|nr:transcription factor VOZ1 [Citrus sinensis]KAH9797154.1 transcription factor VOZ1 [Citrus sinensis]